MDVLPPVNHWHLQLVWICFVEVEMRRMLPLLWRLPWDASNLVHVV
jgi:hypothetical protein